MLKKVIAVSMLAVFVFGLVGGTFTLSNNRVQAADQQSNMLNVEKVIKIVKEKYTDAQVKSVEKEMENNKTIYAVEFTDASGEHEINVEADTGKIIKNSEKENANYQSEDEEHHDDGDEEDDHDNQDDEQDNESEDHEQDDDYDSNE